MEKSRNWPPSWGQSYHTAPGRTPNTTESGESITRTAKQPFRTCPTRSCPEIQNSSFSLFVFVLSLQPKTKAPFQPKTKASSFRQKLLRQSSRAARWRNLLFYLHHSPVQCSCRCLCSGLALGFCF